MKLHIMSDLHLEFGAFDFEPTGDVLVLAGDIHVGIRGFPFVKEACKKYRAVIMVLGNHEFYNNEYTRILECWKDLEEREPNFFLLHNEAVIIGGVRFIGTTLWTNGDMRALNDFNCITYHGKLLTPQDTQKFHREAVEFLLDEFEKPIKCKTVVVTHHAPIPECVVPKYYNDPINCMFHANLGPIIEDNDILAWVHGHMHDTIQFEYANTLVVCNPRGYVGYQANFGFEHGMILDTDTYNGL